jgi:hypothetical protein
VAKLALFLETFPSGRTNVSIVLYNTLSCAHPIFVAFEESALWVLETFPSGKTNGSIVLYNTLSCIYKMLPNSSLLLLKRVPCGLVWCSLLVSTMYKGVLISEPDERSKTSTFLAFPLANFIFRSSKLPSADCYWMLMTCCCALSATAGSETCSRTAYIISTSDRI